MTLFRDEYMVEGVLYNPTWCHAATCKPASLSAGVPACWTQSPKLCNVSGPVMHPPSFWAKIGSVVVTRRNTLVSAEL